MDTMDYMTPILLLCSAPIVGIVGWTLIRITETITGRRVGGTNPKLLGYKNANEKQELQRRIENLETIIAGMDNELLEDLLRSQNINTNKYDRNRLENFAKQLKNSQAFFNSDNDTESVKNNIKVVANKLLKRLETYIDEQDQKDAKKKRHFRGF